MELTDYWKIIRSHWISFLAITVCGALLGLGWAMLQPKVYTANASGLVSAGVSSDLGSAMAGESYAKSRVKSYEDLARSRSVAGTVKEDLGLSESTDELLASISISSPDDTATLKVAAASESPEGARQLAEAWVQAISEHVDEIENASSTVGAAQSIVTFRSLDSAQLPTDPSSPNTKRAIAVGGLIGLALSCGYALVRNTFDRRISSTVQVEKETGQPVLGKLPQAGTLTAEDRLVTSVGGNDRNNQDGDQYAIAESLRELRTNLQFMNIDNPPRKIVITSALPGEGKSTVTSNLAVTIAASGQKVVVVDADLRRSMIAKIFGLLQGVGLTDVLIGQADIDDVLQPWGPTGNLFVLGAGKIPPNPSELLGSNAFHQVIEELSKDAMVLIDAPPLLPVTDAAVLTARTDGALLVGRVRKTTYEALNAALQNLERVKARPLGIILNGVPMTGVHSGEYGYNYMSYYAHTDSQRQPAAKPLPDKAEYANAMAEETGASGNADKVLPTRRSRRVR